MISPRRLSSRPAAEVEIRAALEENEMTSPDEIPRGSVILHGWTQLVAALTRTDRKREARRS